MFVLDPVLEGDTAPVAILPLCHARLMRDARFPWLILVPALPGLREVHDLGPADRARLIEEVATASRALERLYAPDKVNIGALGNIVTQLHVHVVARRIGDPAWPGPVWGSGEAVPYAADDLTATCARLKVILENS